MKREFIYDLLLQKNFSKMTRYLEKAKQQNQTALFTERNVPRAFQKSN